MTPALVNLSFAIAIVVTAAWIGYQHVRCRPPIGNPAYVGAAVLLLATLSVVTAILPVFTDLREYTDAFRFAAGALRGATLVLLLAYLLRFHRRQGCP